MTGRPAAQDIARALAVLRDGGLVAFPTETVYGLGADARNVHAVRRIFETKGRPADHPVIVHLADGAQVKNWAADIPPAAHALGKAFWPGPLTLILRRATGVLDAVTGGQDTVAVRVPSHPVAHELLAQFGEGVAAPSANRFGRVSATTADHVRAELGDAVDCILDGGEADVGIESTIVDVSSAEPKLLRPGWITVAQMEAVLGVKLSAPDAQAPRAPGTLAKHYAPQTTLLLLEGDLINELAATLVRQGQRVAVLARTALQPLVDGLLWHTAPPDAAGYAHALYSNLRQLDALRCEVILVEKPPEDPAWAAINDRLLRAAAGSAAQDEA